MTILSSHSHPRAPFLDVPFAVAELVARSGGSSHIEERVDLFIHRLLLTFHHNQFQPPQSISLLGRRRPHSFAFLFIVYSYLHSLLGLVIIDTVPPLSNGSRNHSLQIQLLKIRASVTRWSLVVHLDSVLIRMKTNYGCVGFLFSITV